MILAIDPGDTGAAAIVDPEGSGVAWLVSWRRRQHLGRPCYVVTTTEPRDVKPQRVRTLAAVGRIIAEAASCYVITAGACEGQASVRGHGAQSIFTLARTAGLLASVTLDENDVPWAWPTCREWRPKVGIAPATGRKDAKRWAQDIVRKRAGLVVGEDEAEAICIAWSQQ